MLGARGTLRGVPSRRGHRGGSKEGSGLRQEREGQCGIHPHPKGLVGKQEILVCGQTVSILPLELVLLLTRLR